MTARSRRFDLICFDWDGTLFDSTALIARCIQAACADIGVPVPTQEQASYVIGLGLHDALQHVVPGLPPARYPELGNRYRHHYIARQDDLVLFDGTLAMLTALKTRNHWLAVATGKSRRDAERTLMIGDTTHDLQMAANAGCASVAVSFGAHEPAAFAALGPLHIAHSTAELDAWLAAHA
ncbi:MAG: HAD family hydrolase [Burkholderiales bacterium PBB5]|nr:MAG: HAD family hydrolase [Burkholderiales bacterium PBB5]